MKISLRKARLLEKEIATYISRHKPADLIPFSIYDDIKMLTVSETLADKSSDFLNKTTKILELISFRYSIRTVIDVKNRKFITDALTKKQKLTSKVDFLELYSGSIKSTIAGKTDSSTVVLNQLVKFAEIQSTDYYPEIIHGSLLSKTNIEFIQREIKKYKKEISKLSDDIMEANIKTHIELSAEEIELLEYADISI